MRDDFKITILRSSILPKHIVAAALKAVDDFEGFD